MYSEEFIVKLRDALLNDYVNTYKEIYKSTLIDNKIEKDPYWFNALSFYHSLPESERAILFKIIQQTIIDTTSTILGIIDGPVSLEGVRGDFVLTYKDANEKEITLSGDLQDNFLSITHVDK